MCNRPGLTRRVRWINAAIILTVLAYFAGANPKSVAASSSQSFLTLQDGLTQQIFGVTPNFMGGVAFAPNGDPWVDNCSFNGSSLYRFDVRQAVQANGTTYHPNTTAASNAGCGLTNHPDGFIYSNTSSGAVQINANTGAATGVILGSPGNALGIAVDPQTFHLVYVGQDCRGNTTCSIIDVNPATGDTKNFAQLSATDSQFVDGVQFDPTGRYLLLSNRQPQYRLTVLDRAGHVVQHIAMSSEPDGIAIHGIAPRYVVTNNTDGTISRFDFPDDDYTKSPTQSTIASGGYRGDLTQVGPDGCFYVTQNGTRYDDGTTSSENSLVQICPGFLPPPGILPLVELSPSSASVGVGRVHTLAATVRDQNHNLLAGVNVNFAVTGANSETGNSTTGANGQATFSYTGVNSGLDTAVATATVGGLTTASNAASIDWVVLVTLTCQTVTGQSIEFPMFPSLTVVRDLPLARVETTYGFTLSGNRCPEAPIAISAGHDPSVVLKSSNGNTILTVGQNGLITTNYNVFRDHTYGAGIEPTPLTLVFRDTQSSHVGDSFFELEQERTLEYRTTFKPPRESLAYLVAVSSGAALIIYEVGTEAAAELAPLILELAPAVAIIPLDPKFPRSAVGNETHAPQAVIDDLGAVFGPEFVNFATVNSLTVDSFSKFPGDSVAYYAQGFTPNGRVYVSLTQVGTSSAAVEGEAQADANGVVSGTVQLPTNAAGGNWLVAAVDAQTMANSLHDFAINNSKTLNFLLAANVVGVRQFSYLPLISRP